MNDPLKLYQVTAHARVGTVPAAGRAWGKLPVSLQLTPRELDDLWAKRDRLNVTWPPGWTAPDGSTPGGPDPMAEAAAIAQEATPTPLPEDLPDLSTPTRVEHALKAATTFCCHVGGHPSADAINRELKAGGRGNSVRQVAGRYSIGKSAVGDHRRKCLGITGADSSADTPADSTADADTTTPPNHVASPARSHNAPNGEGKEGHSKGHAKDPSAARARGGQNAILAREALDEGQRVAAERVRVIADMVSLGQWNGRSTVVLLSGKWSVPEELVEYLHRVAAAKVAAARGSRRAALETSLARTKAIYDAEATVADRYSKAALTHMSTKDAQGRVNANDVRSAETCTRIAEMARSGQLAAQKHIDTLLGLLKPGSVTMNVAITTDPDFEEAWRVIAMGLEVLAPGVAPQLMELIAIHEDHGEAGAAEWLAEKRADRAALVVQGEPR